MHLVLPLPVGQVYLRCRVEETSATTMLDGVSNPRLPAWVRLNRFKAEEMSTKNTEHKVSQTLSTAFADALRRVVKMSPAGRSRPIDVKMLTGV